MSAYTPAVKYKVLLASPWENPRAGTSGIHWTVVGRAFMSRDGTGMNVYLHANLSVTGMLVIRVDDGTDASDYGTPADTKAAQQATSRKRPTPNVPFPAGDPDDDIPF